MSTGVIGKGPFAEAEHGITELELRHSSSYRCYLTGDIDAGPMALHPPVQRIDGSGANPYDDFVVLRNRLFEVLYFEDLSDLGLGVNGGFHVGWDSRVVSAFPIMTAIATIFRLDAQFMPALCASESTDVNRR